MAKRLMTVRLPAGKASIEDARRELALREADVDPSFGVVPIDEGLFAILVEEEAADRAAAHGSFANPRIEAFGPPRSPPIHSPEATPMSKDRVAPRETDESEGIEFGSGVFAVLVLVGGVDKTVAYLTVDPPTSASNGTETWYTVETVGQSAVHAKWVDHYPDSTHDGQVLKFDWLQADIAAFAPPSGPNLPTYKKWVHTVPFPVAYP